jgi:hypothetical protein
MFQLTTGWLFGAGAAAISLPILIHLLNRRKFKIVDWAAMEFLLEANRRNRRRILLENLLLLLMRCLAIALLGLLLARPFMSSDSLSMLGMDSVSVHRIVVIDDSPSMRVRAADSDKTALEVAKTAVIELAKRSAADPSDDVLTVRLTSDPRRKLYEGPMTEKSIGDIEQRVSGIVQSDISAKLPETLEAVEKSLVLNRDNSNYVVYVITDLREGDWISPEHIERERKIDGIVERLAEKITHKGEETPRVIVLDVGSDKVENLIVTAVNPINKSVIVGVESEFEVTVFNAGEQTASQVEVELSFGEGAALKQTIEIIESQRSEVATFRYVFQDSGPMRVQATLTGADRLPIDNQRHYAARVSVGRRILIVDGDRPPEQERWESHFLLRALAPPGDYPSGNVVEMMADTEFESLDLGDYAVVMLCNVYKLTEERLASLEEWVAGGGGLFVSLGDQVDKDSYNDLFYNEGNGLLPAKLENSQGDDSHEVWANPTPDRLNHPVMEIFSGDLGTLAQFVKVFRWWSVSLSEDGTAPTGVTVVNHWTDADQSPGLIEKTFGKGRVMMLTTSVDRGWTDWPLDDSYLYVMHAMVGYMARRSSDDGNALVGLPIDFRMDSSKYADEVEIINASKEKETLLSEADTTGRTLELSYDKTQKSGFYELHLSRLDDKTKDVELFAANLDPNEGRLLRADHVTLIDALGKENVAIQRGVETLAKGDESGWSELWKWILALTLVVLCGEQFMAWKFGRRR